MKTKLTLILITSFIGNGYAQPQTKQQEDIVVTASRVPESQDDTLASVTVINRKDIENSQAQSLAELLQSINGLSISNDGGAGKNSSIFMRGTNSDHVLFLIDGVRAGSATTGKLAFEHLSLDQIEKIEIVRGPRTSLYGADALGGVIQIFTRKNYSKHSSHFSAGFGSFQSQKLSAGFAKRTKQHWFNINLSKYQTDGFDACDNANVSCGNEPDKDGYDNSSASLRAGLKLSPTVTTEFSWLGNDAQVDFDGAPNSADIQQHIMNLKTTWSPSNKLDIDISLSQNIDKLDNYNDGNYYSRFNTQRDMLSIISNYFYNNSSIIAGIDYQIEAVDSSLDYDKTTRDNLGIFAQYKLQKNKHSYQISLRNDDNQHFGNHLTGNIAWGYQFNQRSQIHVNAGTAFKAPSFNFLYYPYGYGNPNLMPEESLNFEIGIRHKFSKTSQFTANYFLNYIDNLIISTAPNYIPENIDKARIEGIELALRSKINAWHIHSQLTLMDPKNAGDGSEAGNQLLRRERIALRLDLYRYWGKKWRFGSTFIAKSKRYDYQYDQNFNANRVELDAYELLDLNLNYKFNKRWSLQARIVNVFDTDYETVLDYKQAERNYFLSFKYQD